MAALHQRSAAAHLRKRSCVIVSMHEQLATSAGRICASQAVIIACHCNRLPIACRYNVVDTA